MPPPITPELDGPDGTGKLVLSGYDVPGLAQVFAVNDRTEATFEVAADRSGAYVLIMIAQVGDPVALWYQSKQGSSATTVFVVP